MSKINVAVIGATGYTGAELVRLLLRHPNVNLKFATSKSYVGEKLGDVYKNFHKITDIICSIDDIEILKDKVDLIFIALPHGIASKYITEDILKKVKVIDLGADFRLNDLEIYEKWYKTEHFSKDLLQKAVYGLCEIHREKIKTANLLANPGCYTTCSILSLAPILKSDFADRKSVIIDAKSGVSGAGRSLNIDVHFNECNESIKAYKIASHRHTPEIEQELSKICNEKINLLFTPHLVPMNRGILATCYVNFNSKISYKQIREIYENFYKNEQFIRILPQGIFPETRWVKGSNFVDIGFHIDERTNKAIIVGALDNLLKGAAGAAVQNMNLMFDLKEDMGIDFAPSFPI